MQPPKVSIDQAAGRATRRRLADPLPGQVHATGFDETDLNFAGSTVGGNLLAAVSGTGADYTVSVTGMAGEGTVELSIPAGGAVDGSQSGNAASTSTDNVVHFGNVPPTVTINQAVGQADPTNTSPISFAVQFSEPVTGFTADDVSLSGTVGGTLVAAVSGSGADYTVTVTGMSGVGTVVASIPAGGVVDGAGNTNEASTSTDNSVLFDNIGQLRFGNEFFFTTLGEGGFVRVTVVRTGGTDGPVSVDLALADDSAHSGGSTAEGQNDYTPITHTFSWAHGESGARIANILIPDDPLNEGTETFHLSLVNPVGQPHLGLTEATAFILPSDPVGPGTYFDQDGDKYTVKLTGGVGQLAMYRTDATATAGGRSSRCFCPTLSRTRSSRRPRYPSRSRRRRGTRGRTPGWSDSARSSGRG